MSFHDWWTNENNPSLPKSEYLFGTRHIIVLVTVAVLTILFSLLFYKKSEKARRIVVVTLVSILLMFEIVSRVVNLCIETDYSWQNILKILLPMHICSVMVWIFIIAIFSKSKALLDFSAVGGFLATISFLLFPAVGLNRTYMSFTCIYSTVSHMIGFMCSILVIVYGFAKLEFKNIWKTYLCFTVMFCWGALLDFVIFPGSDYMYLRNNPVDFDFWGIPYQVFGVLAIIVYVALFYLVVWLCKLPARKKRTGQSEQV